MSNPDRVAIIECITSMIHDADNDRIILTAREGDGTVLSQLVDAIVAAVAPTEAAAMAATVPAKPVAYWIEKAEQFCLPSKDGTRPFDRNWQPLYAAPQAPVAGQPVEPSPASPPPVTVALSYCSDAERAGSAVLSTAARDVLAERARQISIEGWDAARDDRYIDCELAAAAASYALCDKDPGVLQVMGVRVWPWPLHWWKPTTYRRNLVKAGALILAEIERIDRRDAPKGDSNG